MNSPYLDKLNAIITDDISLYILDGWPLKELENILKGNYSVIDSNSFLTECIKEDYGNSWFNSVFTKITQSNNNIVTLAQFVCLTKMLDPSYFKDKAIILSEGLRIYFPLLEKEFIEKIDSGNLESRDQNMPKHHIEHLKIGGKFFFIQGYDFDLKRELVFTTKKELSTEKNDSSVLVDASNSNFELELVISNIVHLNTNSSVHILYSPKNPLSNSIIDRLCVINNYKDYFDLDISIGKKTNKVVHNKVSTTSIDLLKKYWGNNADFRNIRVYEDPDISNEQIEISQGQIVDLIISEVEKGRNNIMPRDLFLTAPTGSGKSLLFQLPSFYSSEHGDMVIVISPLIALMKDQVHALISDRGFTKVAYLNSELSFMDREVVLTQAHAGEIDVLYLSPELLLSYNISHFIGQRNLGLVVIDEAHLITTWGRDFRVDYWFLGNHLRKVKKYNELTFPIVAVTATAVYGGMNDMVFDTLSSLELNNPYVFIGSVRRDDISFAITNNSLKDNNKKFDNWKINQTADFIMKLSLNTDLKLLVYAPYTSHVKKIFQKVDSQIPSKSGVYYGNLDSALKEDSFHSFLNNDIQTIICTKAFGMGIDIPDIQVVYHHAPSGHLPDYIQEVGRLARKPDIRGFAALNYSEKDKIYSKRLFGMSALHHYQVQGVLKKLYEKFSQTKNQNLLISVDDFSHIFDDVMNIDQKVLTALMMIEKDYLEKFRFNVVIARPKKLFVKVYARINSKYFSLFSSKFKGLFKELEYSRMNERGFHIISIDLDLLWKKYFSKENFPTLKYKFYSNKLFSINDMEVVPQLKLELIIKQDLESTLSIFDFFIKKIESSFTVLSGHYFSESDLEKEISKEIKDTKSIKLSKFLLNTYSSNMNGLSGSTYEKGSFLARRRSRDIVSYRIFSRAFMNEFSALRKRLSSLFGDGNQISLRYLTYNDNAAAILYRLGQWIEILDLGTFSSSGGENPMIFVRLNDPKKIENDSSGYYKNELLQRTRDKHLVSNRIFDHFFQNNFSNSERWGFIEDYFLGVETDDLLEKYSGSGNGNQNDLISIISDLCSDEVKVVKKKKSVSVFRKESPSGSYCLEDSLSMNIDGELITKKVSKWIISDAILFHKNITKRKIFIKGEAFQILKSRIMNDKPYFTQVQGVKKRIDFHGYDNRIQVSVLLKDCPSKFYKWWIKNLNEVYLPFKEKYILLSRVSEQGVSLSREHKKWIKDRNN